MNPSQHAEQFQRQLANYVPQFTPEFWPVWLIIAGVLLVGISALRPDWQKAFRPFASVPARNTH